MFFQSLKNAIQIFKSQCRKKMPQEIIYLTKKRKQKLINKIFTKKSLLKDL